jgi:hypothetical protein
MKEEVTVEVGGFPKTPGWTIFAQDDSCCEEHQSYTAQIEILCPVCKQKHVTY